MGLDILERWQRPSYPRSTTQWTTTSDRTIQLRVFSESKSLHTVAEQVFANSGYEAPGSYAQEDTEDVVRQKLKVPTISLLMKCEDRRAV